VHVGDKFTDVIKPVSAYIQPDFQPAGWKNDKKGGLAGCEKRAVFENRVILLGVILPSPQGDDDQPGLSDLSFAFATGL